MTYEKVDVSQELSQLLPSCTNVDHVIGVSRLPGVGGGRLLAVIRCVTREEGPLRPWPLTMVCRRAKVLPKDIDLFLVGPPDETLDPWLATEWLDSYEEFVSTMEATGYFMLEIYQPGLRHTAIVQGGAVLPMQPQIITLEEFEAVAAGKYTKSAEQDLAS